MSAVFLAHLISTSLNAAGWIAETPDTAILILGNGGPAWTQHARALYPNTNHPVDTLTRDVVRALEGCFSPGVVRSTHVPFAPDALDFTALAARANMACVGHLGLLMHPRFGPWWGLRAVLVLDAAHQETLALREALESAPEIAFSHSDAPPPTLACDTCEDTPCRRACPARERVFSTPRLNLRACVAHIQGGGCVLRCDARAACPAGEAYRYDDAVHAHHHGQLREWLTSTI